MIWGEKCLNIGEHIHFDDGISVVIYIVAFYGALEQCSLNSECFVISTYENYKDKTI